MASLQGLVDKLKKLKDQAVPAVRSFSNASGITDYVSGVGRAAINTPRASAANIRYALSPTYRPDQGDLSAVRAQREGMNRAFGSGMENGKFRFSGSGAPKLAMTSGGLLMPGAKVAAGIGATLGGLSAGFQRQNIGQGIGSGLSTALQSNAVAGLTNPVLSKIMPKGLGVLGSRLIPSAANVGQGMVIDRATGQQTTPLSAGIDLGVGLFGGRGQFDVPKAASRLGSTDLAKSRLSDAVQPKELAGQLRDARGRFAKQFNVSSTNPTIDKIARIWVDAKGSLANLPTARRKEFDKLLFSLKGGDPKKTSNFMQQLKGDTGQWVQTPRGLKKIGGNTDMAFGAAAGFEPELDENGKPTGKIKFNPTTAALGVGAMAGVKAINGNLPTKGVEPSINRTQLTGKQLSTPSNQLFRGDLPLTQKQLLQAGVEVPQGATPKITASQLVTSNDTPARFRTTLPGGQEQGIRVVGGQTKTGLDTPTTVSDIPTLSSKQTVKASTDRLKVSSSTQSIPPAVQAEIKAVERAVDKKVGILDYLRTPDRVLKKIGLEKEATQIKQAYNNYLDELPQQIDKITQWSKRVGPGAERRIFRYLDGQKQALSGEELKVAGEMQSYLKNWADRLDLPEDSRIASYITHIFEKDLIQKEFDPDLAKIIDAKIPGSVYDPFLQERLGAQGYVEDAFRALDAYVKRATRKANMDPALYELEANSNKLDIDSWKYIKTYTDRINLRPTELDNLLDNFIKQSPVGYKFGQRPTAAISRGVRQMVYRGTLGLNIGSAIRNLTQGVNTYSQLGEIHTGIGYMKSLRAMVSGDDELARAGVLRDNMVQDRALSATKKFWGNMDKGLFYFFEQAEKINRGAAYFGAKSKALSQGRSEQQAVEAGLEMARKTQFTFGSVDTPVAMQGDLVKLATQFQSYNLKQAEFLGEMAKNKEYAGMIRWTAANLAILATVGQVMGWDYKDMIPFGDIIGGERQFGATPPIQLAGDVGRLALGGKDKFNQPVGVDTIANDLVPFVPAGVQIKKTIDGLSDVARGYDQSNSGRVKFPLPQTPGAFATAGILGTAKTKEARDYKSGGGSVLGEKQSQMFKQAGDGRIKLFNDIEAKRQKDNAKDALKEQIKKTGQAVKTDKEYTYQDPDSGDIKTISLDFTVPEPKLTGNEALDKKVVSAYKGDITKKTNDILKLYELGQMSAEEAEKLLDGLQAQTDKTKKPKKVKIKASSTKSSAIKVKAVQFAKAKITAGKLSLPGIKVKMPTKPQGSELAKGSQLLRLSQETKPKKITFNKIKVSKA